ncbi:hypothetical protein B9G55_06215 [Saccharibacillus sp. O16]|nr:hypothetical protein B9G55_06215 [Saccharibacillus sp. O16]
MIPFDKELEQALIRLAQGEWSPEEWQSWWDTHADGLAQRLPRGLWLKLKPIRHGFRWMGVLTSQKRAIEYLTQQGVSFQNSDRYQQNYLDEFNTFRLEQKHQDEAKLEALRQQIPQLFGTYPKFAASLKRVYNHTDVISAGAGTAQIEQTERLLGFRLPEDVRQYFGTVETLSIEGIRIELGALRSIELKRKTYIVLGEFWKEADGDLLLIKPEHNEMADIYYYAHTRDHVRKLCSGMTALLENKFSSYNRL